MATINPTRTTIFPGSGRGDGSVVRLIWTPVTSADSCAPVCMPEYADKSVQALGTFGSASVALNGSNDGGVTYAALRDPGGTTFALTSAGIKAVLENTEWVQPSITGGDGTQSLSICMVLRLSNPLRT